MIEANVIEGATTERPATRASRVRSSAGVVSVGAIVASSGDRARWGCAAIAAFLAGAASNGSVPWATTATIVALLPVLMIGQRSTMVPPALLAAAAGLGGTVWVASAANTPLPLGAALVGAALTAAPLAVAQYAVPSTLASSDTKLAAVLGGGLGLVDPTAGLVAISIGATLTVAVSLLRRRPVAVFAPGLVAGAVGVVVAVAWL